MDIEKEIRQTIRDALNLRHVDMDAVPLETSLGAGGLNLDSVDILELVVTFEQKYRIKLDDSQSAREHFKTLGSVINMVKSLAAN